MILNAFARESSQCDIEQAPVRATAAQQQVWQLWVSGGGSS